MRASPEIPKEKRPSDALARWRAVGPKNQLGETVVEAEAIGLPESEGDRVPPWTGALHFHASDFGEAEQLLDIPGNWGHEGNLIGAGITQALRKTLEVLAPIEIGIHQDLFRLTAHKFVEIGEVIRV